MTAGSCSSSALDQMTSTKFSEQTEAASLSPMPGWGPSQGGSAAESGCGRVMPGDAQTGLRMQARSSRSCLGSLSFAAGAPSGRCPCRRPPPPQFVCPSRASHDTKYSSWLTSVAPFREDRKWPPDSRCHKRPLVVWTDSALARAMIWVVGSWFRNPISKKLQTQVR